MTPDQREQFEDLLMALVNAEFECGEHDSDECDEPYEVVHCRAIKAKSALRAFVETLN